MSGRRELHPLPVHSPETTPQMRRHAPRQEAKI
jgi:hypothetical protein